MAAQPEVKILIKAINEAKAVFEQVSADATKLAESMSVASKQIAQSFGDTAKETKEATKEMTSGFKHAIGAISGFATTAVAATLIIDRIRNAQLRVTESIEDTRQAQISYERAQKRANETMKKSGINSTEYRSALDQLQTTYERLTVANDRQTKAAENLKRIQITSALTVIPTVISSVYAAITAYTGLSAALATAGTAAAVFNVAITAGGAAISIAAGIAVIASTGIFNLGKKMMEATGTVSLFEKQLISWGTKGIKPTIRQMAELGVQTGLTADQITSSMKRFGYTVGEIKKVVSAFDLLNRTAEDVGVTITTTFKERLVNEAANRVEQFTALVSGRLADIRGGSDYVKMLVEDTNYLIQQGLVGQAQENIRTFVECVVDKNENMTLYLTEQIDTLQMEMNEKYQAMTRDAMRTEGDKRSKLLDSAEKMKTQYTEKINILKDWHSIAFESMYTEAGDISETGYDEVLDTKATFDEEMESNITNLTVSLSEAFQGMVENWKVSMEEAKKVAEELELAKEELSVPVVPPTLEKGEKPEAEKIGETVRKIVTPPPYWKTPDQLARESANKGIVNFFGGVFSGIGGFFKGLFGMQEGGIVTEPTVALIGEAGPEVVIPLEKIKSIEKMREQDRKRTRYETFFNTLPVFQFGGIVTEPTISLLGEKGPEAVVPLERLSEVFQFSKTEIQEFTPIEPLQIREVQKFHETTTKNIKSPITANITINVKSIASLKETRKGAEQIMRELKRIQDRELAASWSAP